MKAMILAAGVGSRLGSLTENTPKCLVDIHGTPMLRLAAEKLALAGVKKVIINIHHHAEQVKAYASSALTDLFSDVEFSFEPKLLGTGGGLKATASFFADQQNFFLVNADIFSSFDLKNLIQPLKEDRSKLACLAVMDRKDTSYLEFDAEGNFCGWVRADKLSSSNEESRTSETTLVRAFCGQQALSTKIFDYLALEQQTSFSIIETYMQAFQAGEKIVATDIGAESWFDMGTPHELARLREKLNY